MCVFVCASSRSTAERREKIPFKWNFEIGIGLCWNKTVFIRLPFVLTVHFSHIYCFLEDLRPNDAAKCTNVQSTWLVTFCVKAYGWVCIMCSDVCCMCGKVLTAAHITMGIGFSFDLKKGLMDWTAAAGGGASDVASSFMFNVCAVMCFI